MTELCRIIPLDLILLPKGCGGDLSGLLMGKHVINNPKAIRYDDRQTGDIIFYEMS